MDLFLVEYGLFKEFVFNNLSFIVFFGYSEDLRCEFLVVSCLVVSLGMFGDFLRKLYDC